MNTSQKKLQEWLKTKQDLDGFLVTKLANIRWLTGFSGSFSLFLQTKKSFLITDSRYAERAKKLCKKNCEFVLFDKKTKESFGKKYKGTWGIEDSISIAHKKQLKKLFPNIKFKIYSSVLEELRRQKTSVEIEKIEKAQGHVDKILHPFLRTNLKTGITEQELAFKLEIAIRNNGEFEPSFDPIVAFGENSAIPHHRPEMRKLKKGDNILIDCGAKFEGYHSDMTRNFGFGKLSPAYQTAYDDLLAVQEKTITAFEVDKKTKKIDEICRKLLKGNAKFFTHSLGHGLGLEIHEPPSLASTDKNILLENEVVTCEPGLYFPKKFGIRIEDPILITKKGPQVLSRLSKKIVYFG